MESKLQKCKEKEHVGIDGENCLHKGEISKRELKGLVTRI